MPSYKNILVVSDNRMILEAFIGLLESQPDLAMDKRFSFACHPKNSDLANQTIQGFEIKPLDMKNQVEVVTSAYDIVISAHCKQIFPANLVSAVKCINIHPGYNPYNRGWYPQVFSILNGLPLGATIHEIDQEIDHGPIIDQQKVDLYASDTSLSAYDRVQQAELRLLRTNLAYILSGSYRAHKPDGEGNLNLKDDFQKLTELDMDEKLTFKQAIDRLRALSHSPFKNAYFVDKETGKRIWVEIKLDEDKDMME